MVVAPNFGVTYDGLTRPSAVKKVWGWLTLP